MCWFRFIGLLSDIYRTFKPFKSTEAYLKHGLPEPRFEEYQGFRVELFFVSKQTATRDLSHLVDLNILQKIGQTGKRTYYVLASKGS